MSASDLVSLQRTVGNSAVNRMAGDASGQSSGPVIPWLVFGVDGRDKAQLESAVNAGYRHFDTAESYGNISTVAKVLKTLPRPSYKIIYKFDVQSKETSDALQKRLGKIASLFEGKIDTLIIHNQDGVDHGTFSEAWGALKKLKEERIASNIGLGNVRDSDMDRLAEAGNDLDAVENSAGSALLNESVKQAINDSGAHLYYYDVINTAKQMNLNLEDPGELQGLIYQMSVTFSKDGRSNATMISSSGSTDRQARNLRDFGIHPDDNAFTGDEKFGAMEKIADWHKKQSVGHENADFELRPEVHSWLVDLLAHTKDMRDKAHADAKNARIRIDGPFIRKWIVNRGTITEDELRSIKIPSRTGLKTKYIGMPLEEILVALLGETNCATKWAIELVQVMLTSIDSWDVVRGGFPETTGPWPEDG